MILGHASPEATRKIYAHVMRNVTAAQVEKATELLTQHRRSEVGGLDEEPAVPAVVPAPATTRVSHP